MSRLSQVRAAMRRAVARLVPAGRRDWVEALWAEAPEVPPGLRRLAWCAGGVQLVAREALMRRRIGSAVLFAVAATLVAWAAWPGSQATFATSVDRVDVITMLVLLSGLALVARRVFGPPGSSRAARFLRLGAYATLLALIPAKNVVEQVLDVPPRGGIDLRLYRLISGSPSPGAARHGAARLRRRAPEAARSSRRACSPAWSAGFCHRFRHRDDCGDADGALAAKLALLRSPAVRRGRAAASGTGEPGSPHL